MRKVLISLLILFLPVAAFGRPVYIILQNSTVVSGEMLGSNSTTIFLNEKGQAREILLSEVKAVFDAKTNESLNLTLLPHSSPAIQAAPSPSLPVTEKSSGASVLPSPAPASVTYQNDFFQFDFGFDMGAGPENGQVIQLWTQLVPPQCNRDLNRLFMGLDIDFMVRIFDWFSIGPFFNWMFMAPGLNSTLVYSGGGYWVYYGGYWYYYDYGHTEVSYSMDFNNTTYGVVTRFNFISEPELSVHMQLAVGYLDLAGGYEVSVNGTRRQRADLHGSSPYRRLTVGIDAGDRFSRFGMEIGYQSALITNINATIIQNDYYRQEENTTWPVIDSRDGSNIKVDYSSPLIMCYVAFCF